MEIYIPHSSDKTVPFKKKIINVKTFISHIVQTKLGYSPASPLRVKEFISHIVQTKQIIPSKAIKDLNIFISHIVQTKLIKLFFVFWI